jgi:ABC-type polysaccharide/polyol phosphate transport system ATPase subunit
MSSPVISCTGIHKSFSQAIYPSVHLQDHLLHWRRHRRQWRIDALTNIDLQVGRGEWVGLYGPNGSGKTTLLRIIAGLLPADQGGVRLTGRLSAFLGLGAGFHSERSAIENIYIHGLLHGLSRREVHESINEILAFAGIESHRDVPVKCLSTGMMLRLAYAASSFIDSDIYLFDETLAVGDSAFRERCRTHLRSMRERGKTVLLVSHGLDELKTICDRVIHMEKGKITGTEDTTGER